MNRKTKKNAIDTKKNATALTVTILKKTFTLHRAGLPRTYKRRSTATIPRLANTGRDALYGTNIKHLLIQQNRA